MASYTATFPEYDFHRNSSYIGIARGYIENGSTVSIEVDDNGNANFGGYVVLSASGSAAAAGQYIPGRASAVFTGPSGVYTVNFAAASTGGPGYITVSGFSNDYPVTGTWIETTPEEYDTSLDFTVTRTEISLYADKSTNSFNYACYDPVVKGQIIDQIDLWPLMGILTITSDADWILCNRAHISIPEHRTQFIDVSENTTGATRVGHVTVVSSNFPDCPAVITVTQLGLYDNPEDPTEPVEPTPGSGSTGGNETDTGNKILFYVDPTTGLRYRYEQSSNSFTVCGRQELHPETGATLADWSTFANGPTILSQINRNMLISGSSTDYVPVTKILSDDYSDLYGAFRSSTAHTIIIPASIEYIEPAAFSNSKNLTSLIVNASNSVYKSSNNCIIKKLTKTLTHGCKSSVISSDVLIIGAKAFYSCTELTRLEIPGNITSIEPYAYYGCSGLTSILLGTGHLSIPISCFASCTSVKNINIPSNITTIETNAFNNCTALSEVYFGASLQSIGGNSLYNGAFYNCINLETVINKSNSLIPSSSYVFNKCDNLDVVYYTSPTAGYVDGTLWCDKTLRFLGEREGNHFFSNGIVTGNIILADKNIIVLGNVIQK